MPDPVSLSIAGTAAIAMGKTGIVDTIRDVALDFLVEQTKSLGKEEFANRQARRTPPNKIRRLP